MGVCNVEIRIIEGELSDKVYAKCYDYIKELYKKKLILEAQSGAEKGGKQHDSNLRKG